MFRAPCDKTLGIIFKKAINDCNGNTKCVSPLVKIMEKLIWHRILLIMSKERLDHVTLLGLNLTIAVRRICITGFGMNSWCYATIEDPSTQINVTK